ncbi:hypothetical protein BY91_10810 [Escherichia coli O157:H7 str. K5806]|nr:hypothetical protein BY91_10810 [Escherichia coli O157:H7 str. K5806]
MRGLLFIADIHLYREHLYRFITEVRMCDCLDFISVIRNINSSAGIVALRISLCDNQAVILAEHNSLIPVVIKQAVSVVIDHCRLRGLATRLPGSARLLPT